MYILFIKDTHQLRVDSQIISQDQAPDQDLLDD